MGDRALLTLNEVSVRATVLVTDYGYRVLLPADLGFGACEGDLVRVQVGRVVGEYRWTSTYPVPPERWIALRRKELDRPKKVRRKTGPTVGEVTYGRRYIDPSAPKPD